MSVYFNELTIDEIPQQTYQLLKDFRSVWSTFVSATDRKIKHMILPHSAMEKLCTAVSTSKDPAMMEFLHFFRAKFRESPEDEFSPHAYDRFNGADYFLELEDGKKVRCESLGWAVLNRSITLGLQSSKFWCKLCYDIEEKTIEDEVSNLTALCITEPNHVENVKVTTWIAVNREFADVPEPIPCNIPYEQKEQHISKTQHHEHEKLKAFSDKIVRHQYVCGVVDTLPFDSTTSRFVLKCYDDGKIDIRLHWTKVGSGLTIQTTGKGQRQTELIAKILTAKFDQRS